MSRGLLRQRQALGVRVAVARDEVVDVVLTAAGVLHQLVADLLLGQVVHRAAEAPHHQGGRLVGDGAARRPLPHGPQRVHDAELLPHGIAPHDGRGAVQRHQVLGGARDVLTLALGHRLARTEELEAADVVLLGQGDVARQVVPLVDGDVDQDVHRPVDEVLEAVDAAQRSAGHGHRGLLAGKAVGRELHAGGEGVGRGVGGVGLDDARVVAGVRGEVHVVDADVAALDPQLLDRDLADLDHHSVTRDAGRFHGVDLDRQLHVGPGLACRLAEDRLPGRGHVGRASQGQRHLVQVRRDLRAVDGVVLRLVGPDRRRLFDHRLVRGVDHAQVVHGARRRGHDVGEARISDPLGVVRGGVVYGGVQRDGVVGAGSQPRGQGEGRRAHQKVSSVDGLFRHICVSLLALLLSKRRTASARAQYRLVGDAESLRAASFAACVLRNLQTCGGRTHGL